MSHDHDQQSIRFFFNNKNNIDVLSEGQNEGFMRIIETKRGRIIIIYIESSKSVHVKVNWKAEMELILPY
jgi:hypothetical protein